MTTDTADSQDSDEATAYLTYSIGGLSVGAQRSVDNTSGTGEVLYYDKEYYWYFIRNKRQFIGIIQYN